MSSILIFLTVVQSIVAALLVAVILMQKSEGGGLGAGGSPAGLMSARGAADFLTRSTAVLAVIFVSLSIILAAIAVKTAAPSSVDTSLAKDVVPSGPVAASAPAVDPVALPSASPAADPLGGAAKQ